jgi:hypothetical protein
LSAIPLVAAALYAGRDRRSTWGALSSRRRYALIVVGAVAVLPLVHVAFQVLRITLRGDIVYGAEVDGGAGIARGLEVLYDWLHEAMPRTAQDLMLASVVLVLVAAVARRRVDALALGALGSGALAIAFAAQSGVAVSRYYIPLLALCVVAVSLSLARLPDVVAAAGVIAVFFAFMPPTETRAEVTRWSDEEQQHATSVRLVSDLERSGCTVAAAGLDLESSLALPVLVALESRADRRDCAPAYLVLPPNPSPDFPLLRACVDGELYPLAEGRLLGVYECRQLRSGASRPLEAERFRSTDGA